MAEGTNAIIVDGSTGGNNVIVVGVLPNFVSTASTSVSAAANTFYELTHTAKQTISLPSSPGVGTVIGIGGIGTGLFRVAQASGEQILFGNVATTVGATGYIEAMEVNSVVYLRALTTAGLWLASDIQGNFDIDGTTTNNAINAPSMSADYSKARMYKTFTVDTQSLSVGVWEIWNTGTFNSGLLTDFTRSTSRLTYTGSSTKPFFIDYRLSTDQGAGTAEFQMSLYLNGSIITGTECGFRNTSGAATAASTCCEINLSTNDYIEPFVRAPTTSITMEVEMLTLNIFEI